MNPGQIAVFVPIVFIVSVTSIILARMKLKHESGRITDPRMDEVVERLRHMEQAIDALAIETERISEGQRFTTKLLSERTPTRSAP